MPEEDQVVKAARDAEDERIAVLINPLLFPDVDLAKFEPSRVATPQAILEYACPPGTPADVDSIVARFKELDLDDAGVFAVPPDDRLLNRLIWPLRQAKSAYMFGDYLGTVALCGLVAEMIAILLYEVEHPRVHRGILPAEAQHGLYGQAFEKLGQHRRVEVLLAYGFIGKDTKDHYDRIRTCRKKYLHYWTSSHDDLAADAAACFRSTVRTVVDGLGLGLKDRKIVVRTGLVEYFASSGAEPTDPTDGATRRR